MPPIIPKTPHHPTYKLVYFNVRWLGEPIRYLLSYVGAELEDVRLDWGDWRGGKINDKSRYPYSKLPFLEERVTKDDGVTTVASFSQSFSILKYLGKKHNLVGRDLLEETKCEEISDCVKDIIKEVDQLIVAPDKIKLKLRANFLNITIPRYFSVFEEDLKKWKNKPPGSGAAGTTPDMNMMMPLVGDKITWVDFQLGVFSEEFEKMLQYRKSMPKEGDSNDKADGGDGNQKLLLDTYPLIREHQKWIQGLKGIREWREKRPITEW